MNIALAKLYTPETQILTCRNLIYYLGDTAVGSIRPSADLSPVVVAALLLSRPFCCRGPLAVMALLLSRRLSLQSCESVINTSHS